MFRIFCAIVILTLAVSPVAGYAIVELFSFPNCESQDPLTDSHSCGGITSGMCCAQRTPDGATYRQWTSTRATWRSSAEIHTSHTMFSAKDIIGDDACAIHLSYLSNGICFTAPRQRDFTGVTFTFTKAVDPLAQIAYVKSLDGQQLQQQKKSLDTEDLSALLGGRTIGFISSTGRTSDGDGWDLGNVSVCQTLEDEL
ncbi:hypothetical protein C8R45DRAFT_1088549 [Mycena sanguinolenta]|nr:hypothetical protein C8R45DRAFT_1088549 [Mycena sanguinolenta]